MLERSKSLHPTGTILKTLRGDQDSDENDQERFAAPGETGEVVDLHAGGYSVVFKPSGVWVILDEAEINDPEQYEIVRECESSRT